MSTTPQDDVTEPYARHIGNATLYINADGSWSVGPNPRSLVPVQFDSISRIGDATFGFSAVAVEADGRGGYTLYVRADADDNQVVEVAVDAAGRVDAASIKLLTAAQLYATEDRLFTDLNGNGGYGEGPVLLQGGAVNLYASATSAYQVGTGTGTPVTLTVGGVALTDAVLPPGWDIVDVAPGTGNGYKVYAQDSSGAVFAAEFNAQAAFTGGRLLSAAELDALEQGDGLDIDGDSDLPAPAGWTQSLGNAAIRQLVDAALAGGSGKVGGLGAGQSAGLNTATTTGAITYAELVTMLQTLIRSHKDAGNTPLSADEVSSLQALAARGKAAFAGATAADAEYLAYVFSKMVNGSEANRFYTGGTGQAGELGSLGAGTSVENFEKLVNKWILGKDLPNPATGGDSANAKAAAAQPVYTQSKGSLFVNGVSVADVNQGSMGDCYLLADLGGLAGTAPTIIQAMFVDNGTVDGQRSWGVRFFDAQGKAHWVTVNDMLPTRTDDATRLAYGGQADKSLDGEIWVPLVEKAYAQLNALGVLSRAENSGKNAFMAIEGGGGEPIMQIKGGKAVQYSVTTDPARAGNMPIAGNDYVTAKVVLNTDSDGMKTLLDALKAAMNGGKSIWIGVTTTSKDSFGNQLLVGSHAHFALDANTQSPDNEDVLVYNPWGLVTAPNPPGPTPQEFISPVSYKLSELIGIAGLDFVVLEGG